MVASTRDITLLYRKTSYDFDGRLAEEAGARRRTLLGAMRDIFMSNINVLELNEPLFLRALPPLLLYLLAARLRPLRGARCPRIVTYAIENIDDDGAHVFGPMSSFFARVVGKRLLWLTLANYHRVAFGTEASFHAYQARLGRFPKRLETTIIAPLEPRCAECALVKTRPKIVFVGAFTSRKGIDKLMAAWPVVARLRPDAELAILGKGLLVRQVEAWAEGRDRVSLIVDPPRKEIHRALASARVLVLLSRSSPRWREQVGLPIVEGLSHGCRIVTSSGTGLASWLRRNGHVIIEDGMDIEGAGARIAEALGLSCDFHGIMRSLPPESGRATAEDWLWSN